MRQFMKGLLLGIVATVLLTGAVGFAAVQTQSIEITTLPLRYMFDGVEKVPPSDQQGFIYNSRTYVPLRFMAESLGREVKYDGPTYTIWVGKGPGDNSGKLFAELVGPSVSTVTSLQGQNMINAYLMTGTKDLWGRCAAKDGLFCQSSHSLNLNGRYEKMTGTVFLPDTYAFPLDQSAGKIDVYIDDTRTQSIVLESGKSGPIPFEINLRGALRVKLVYNTRFSGDDVVDTSRNIHSQLGLSDIRLYGGK